MNPDEYRSEAPEPNPARKFVQQTFPMGAEQLFRWDKALAVADALEDAERVKADRSCWSRL